ncbi:hypothetical protein Naga_102503g1, partial [Nannochloropsis gaditana]
MKGEGLVMRMEWGDEAGGVCDEYGVRNEGRGACDEDGVRNEGGGLVMRLEWGVKGEECVMRMEWGDENRSRGDGMRMEWGDDGGMKGCDGEGGRHYARRKSALRGDADGVQRRKGLGVGNDVIGVKWWRRRKSKEARRVWRKACPPTFLCPS